MTKVGAQAAGRGLFRSRTDPRESSIPAAAATERWLSPRPTLRRRQAVEAQSREEGPPRYLDREEEGRGASR